MNLNKEIKERKNKMNKYKKVTVYTEYAENSIQHIKEFTLGLLLTGPNEITAKDMDCGTGITMMIPEGDKWYDKVDSQQGGWDEETNAEWDTLCNNIGNSEDFMVGQM